MVKKVINSNEKGSLKNFFDKSLSIVDGNEVKDIKRILTGIPGFDLITGGGLPVGRIIQLWGTGSVGKSSLALQVMSGVLQRDPDSEVLYIDCEKTVTQDALNAAGMDKKRFYLAQELYGGEQIVDTALEALLHGGAKVVCIDSVEFLKPRDTLDKIDKDSSYVDRQAVSGFLSKMQIKIVEAVSHSNGCLIIINQEGVGYYPPPISIAYPTYIGGKPINHILSINIHMKKKEWKEKPGGIIQTLVTKKNKTYTPFIKTELYMFNRTIDTIASLISMCAQYGFLIKKGGRFSLSLEIAKELDLPTDFKEIFNVPDNEANSELKCIDLVRNCPNLHEFLYSKLMAFTSIKENVQIDEETRLEEENVLEAKKGVMAVFEDDGLD